MVFIEGDANYLWLFRLHAELENNKTGSIEKYIYWCYCKDSLVLANHPHKVIGSEQWIGNLFS